MLNLATRKRVGQPRLAYWMHEFHERFCDSMEVCWIHVDLKPELICITRHVRSAACLAYSRKTDADSYAQHKDLTYHVPRACMQPCFTAILPPSVMPSFATPAAARPIAFLSQVNPAVSSQAPSVEIPAGVRHHLCICHLAPIQRYCLCVQCNPAVLQAPSLKYQLPSDPDCVRGPGGHRRCEDDVRRVARVAR